MIVDSIHNRVMQLTTYNLEVSYGKTRKIIPY